MLKVAIVRIVDYCTRHPWWVVTLALALSSASAVFVERHFAIKTDINELISPDLPWAQRAAEFVKEFPQREILAVIDASTPEVVEQAATKLRQALEARPDLFFEVRQPPSTYVAARIRQRSFIHGTYPASHMNTRGRSTPIMRPLLGLFAKHSILFHYSPIYSPSLIWALAKGEHCLWLRSFRLQRLLVLKFHAS